MTEKQKKAPKWWVLGLTIAAVIALFAFNLSTGISNWSGIAASALAFTMVALIINVIGWLLSWVGPRKEGQPESKEEAGLSGEVKDQAPPRESPKDTRT